MQLQWDGLGEVAGETATHRFCREKWIQVSHTLCCLFMYLFVAILNMFVLVLEVHGTQHVVMVILLESLINTILFTEVLIAMFIQGKRYWKVWLNVVDFCVTVLCFVFFLFFLLQEAEQNVTAELSWTETSLLSFRYFFQLIRLGLIIRGIWPKTEFLTQPDVRFEYEQGFHEGFSFDEDDENMIYLLDPEEEERLRRELEGVEEDWRQEDNDSGVDTGPELDQDDDKPDTTTLINHQPMDPAQHSEINGLIEEKAKLIDNLSSDSSVT
eukprot:gb/GEZN01008673.1/.p1 GENE.gb/GEZN01008673.1/~~gb/GEZN01008673.1/.p1  ORF type:complete len:269 (+),score=58.98 gb/GEZN01008673.1/:456-1262(+)